ncbi:MAG: hypothetical protein WC208_09770 [Gallionella sp.]
MSSPIPATLIRHGIRQVTDNLSPGDVLDEKKLSKSFFLLYRTEMEDRILGRAVSAKKSKGELPCVP